MNALKAAYHFLKATAFHDINLPARMRFRSRPLKDAFGYFYSQPPLIEIDSRLSPAEALKVVAHEMVHAALEQSAACDHHEHDENFRQLAKIVAERMGWRAKDIL